MSEKYRVQFDFTTEAFEELDRLKAATGAVSRAEVVRYAMRILQWTIEEVRSGGEILVRKDGKAERVIFPFLTASSKAEEKARMAGAHVGQ